MTKEQFQENLRVQQESADLAAPGGFGQVRNITRNSEVV